MPYCSVDNVFMQLQNDTFLGQPFTQRIHFMERLCRKAHVKPFGFHAIRHKSAAITFVSSGLNAAQVAEHGPIKASPCDWIEVIILTLAARLANI